MGNKKRTSDILAYARRATVPLFCSKAAPRSSAIQDDSASEGSLPQSPIDLQGSPTAMHGNLGADCVLCSAATAVQMTTSTSIRLRGKWRVGAHRICRRLLRMCVVRFLLPIVIQTAVIVARTHKSITVIVISVLYSTLESILRTRHPGPGTR